jgi:hypothetical protein
VDRAQKYLHRHAFLHTYGFPYSRPNLDTDAEQHAAPHLYGFADSNLAPHNNFNTHAYYASYVDGFPNPDTCYSELHLDSLADAHTAPDTHPYIDSNTNCDANSLRSVCFSHML